MKKAIVRTLKSILPHSIRRKFFYLGLHLSPDSFDDYAFEYALAPDMEKSLDRLKKRGLSVDSILDIGAFEGEFCRMCNRVWPASKILMIEANDKKRPFLDRAALDTGAELHMALLGPENGAEIAFYVMEAGSSVLNENSPLDREVVKMKTETVDNIASGRTFDLVKLDVQGFEIEVLKGATETLKTAKGVLLEVAFLEINEGAPLFAEVVGYMKAKGFEVLDAIDMHRRPLDGATNQIDLFFVPSDSPLLQDTRHFA